MKTKFQRNTIRNPSEILLSTVIILSAKIILSFKIYLLDLFISTNIIYYTLLSI